MHIHRHLSPVLALLSLAAPALAQTTPTAPPAPAPAPAASTATGALSATLAVPVLLPEVGSGVALVTVAVFVDAPEPAMPCGICRQIIAELGPHAEIVSATPRTAKHSTIDQLLPDPFVLRRER